MLDTHQVVNGAPARNNRTILIVIAAIVILCLCCMVIGIVGLINFLAIRSTDTQILPPVEATVEIVPGDGPDAGQPPEGGLGNEILKNDIWQLVASSAIGRGCDRPIGANSTIEVLQEPEDGVWVEEWTVVCRAGESYAYEVEFILDDTGATFSIRPLP